MKARRSTSPHPAGVASAHGGRAAGRNRFRIISGAWRGRRLPFPDVEGLRPSPDRVRETLFNWLAQVIEGARCLDLFAGSGALGLEALSRGAARVVFVDQHEQVVRCLRGNLDALHCDRAAVVQAGAVGFLGGAAEPMDLILLDPPYGEGLLGQAAELVEARGWLRPGGRVYLEDDAAAGAPDIPAGWELLRTRRAGRVGYHLARKRPVV